MKIILRQAEPRAPELARLHAQAGAITQALDTIRATTLHSHDIGDYPQVIQPMTWLVETLADAGNDEAAVVLNSAVASGELRLLMVAAVERQHDLLTDLRARLGDERYEAARARGTGLSGDDLVQYALSEIDEALAHTDPGNA